MFKRILWATDFSEHATHARDWAIHCAQCSGGKLFALAVADVADVPVLSAVVTPEVSQAHLARAEAWTEAELTQAMRERLAQGAREIIVLDLADPREVPVDAHGFGPFLGKLMNTIERRQQEMEIALAEARGAPVWRLALQGEQPAPIWDFSHTPELIERGYEMASREVRGGSADRGL